MDLAIEALGIRRDPVPPTPPLPPPPPSNVVAFNPAGGNFVGTQMVKLSSGVGDAVIRYTIDGSLPGANSPVFNPAMPIMLRETAILRAIGESPTMGKGPMGAGVYVRAGNDVANFQSNLPVMRLAHPPLRRAQRGQRDRGWSRAR